MQIELTKIELELIKNALYEFSVVDSETVEYFKTDYNLTDDMFDELTIHLRKKLDKQ